MTTKEQQQIPCGDDNKKASAITNAQQRDGRDE
jgi:hypothetical protein